MQKDIRVRMSDQMPFAFDFHSAYSNRPSCFNSMGVESKTNANFIHATPSLKTIGLLIGEQAYPEVEPLDQTEFRPERALRLARLFFYDLRPSLNRNRVQKRGHPLSGRLPSNGVLERVYLVTHDWTRLQEAPARTIMLEYLQPLWAESGSPGIDAPRVDGWVEPPGFALRHRRVWHRSWLPFGHFWSADSGLDAAVGSVGHHHSLTESVSGLGMLSLRWLNMHEMPS